MSSLLKRFFFGCILVWNAKETPQALDITMEDEVFSYTRMVRGEERHKEMGGACNNTR